MYRLRRCLNRNDAARRAAAGYLSLLVQRKVTQRSGSDAHPCAGQTFVHPCTSKHAPEPPTFPLRVPLRGKAQGAHPCAPVRAATGSAHPCASRPGRARAELAERKQRARLRHRLATSPGRGCDARRRLRVPTSKATPVTERQDIAMYSLCRVG